MKSIILSACICFALPVAWHASAKQPINPYRFATPAGNGLLTGLEAYWKLDEASGGRSDAKGSNALTDGNTVTSAAGKIGNAAQFTAANTEYLQCSDNASLSLGAGVSFTFSCWIYPTLVDNTIASSAGGRV